MNILYSTDENYSKMCYSSLNSLLEKNKKVPNVKIYIIDNNISNEMKEKFDEIIKQYNRNIYYIDCNSICKGLIKKNDFPVSAYARLFIQDSINEDKILYIDCDTLVKGNLEELFNINLSDNMIAGVIDPLPNYLKSAIEMSQDDNYINSGVLLINLKKWREINFKKHAIKYIEKHNYNVIHHDQGIINGLCKGKILYLSPKYNLMPELMIMNSKKLCKLYNLKYFYSDNELLEAIEKPYIIHFITKFYNRPWCSDCTHPYKNDFLKYYYKVDGKIINSPLDYKTKIRRYIFNHFPFFIFMLFEKTLDINRKRKIKRVMK